MVNKFFKTLYYIFLGALAVVALLLLVPLLPIPGNYQVRVVRSGSMEPAIHTGSIVFVKPVGSYGVGDVITFTTKTFRDDNGAILPVTHRIMEVQTSGTLINFVTKGDANDSIDQGVVRERDVLGKVLFSVPYIGYAVETARQPYGFLTLIMIPALIIISDQVKKIWDEMKKIKSAKIINGGSNIQ